MANTSSPLPDTVTFEQIANSAFVSGYFTSLDPLAPSWGNTVSSLGTYNRNVAVSVSLKASPGGGRSITGYNVVGPAQKMLPAGLYMATNATAQAATITGNVDLYPLQFSEPEVPFAPSPTWTTNAGVLADAILRTAYTVNLSATPLLGNSIANFVIVTGSLPFGVQLVKSGTNAATLSGTLDPTAALADPSVVSLPAPTWNTNSGSLATAFNGISGNAVNVSLSASPTYGNAIVLYGISGQTTVLPEGVSLNGATGVITGNVSSIAASQDSQYRLPGPTWNTASGSLGSANNGTAVSLNLSFTPLANTTAAVSVAAGGIPAGTYLTTTNAVTGTATISGTLDANTIATSTTLNVARVFAFTLRATGSDGGYSDQAFTFTANVT